MTKYFVTVNQNDKTVHQLIFPYKISRGHQRYDKNKGKPALELSVKAVEKRN